MQICLQNHRIKQMQMTEKTCLEKIEAIIIALLQ